MQHGTSTGNKGLLRRLGLASARTAARTRGRDGFFADAERVEDDYARLRRPHE